MKTNYQRKKEIKRSKIMLLFNLIPEIGIEKCIKEVEKLA